MKRNLLLALLVMLVVAVFSVQNADVITVRFLHWHFALSQALVIVLSAFSGALAGLIIGAISSRKPASPRRGSTQAVGLSDDYAARE